MRTRKRTSRWEKLVGKRLNEVGDRDVGFRTYGEETRKEKIVSDADKDDSELYSRVPFNPLTMLQSHVGAL